ncbi:MAG TPA: GEVED domain-containing protein, partial [Flavobacteriales bacterium]|nr:GEVED domain-containing protein [Flavobacteriales bacterium]
EDLSSCLPNTYLNDAEFPGITFGWTITNGITTLNSSARRPTFTLATAGVYNATLTVTTSLGTYTRTENGVVVVAAAPVAACTPTTSNQCNCAQTVNNVVFNTISNATSTINNVAYTDLACTHNTVLAAGGTYPLSVTIRAGGSAAESLNGYIDYNNNGVFEDPSELVISGSTPANTTSTINANVTIPGGAVMNTLLRMRLYGEAGTLSANERNCLAATFVGDVEDYGVYVSNSVAGVSIAATPGTTITYGTNVTFTPTPVNGGAAPTYTWFRNGAPVGQGATYQSNDLLPGETIRCEMASNLAGVLSSPALSNTLTMTVTGPPLSDFTADRTSVCAGGTVTFDDLSLLSPTGWSWSFPGGTPSTSTAANPVVTYNTPGTYAVTLTASNVNGSGSTMTKPGYITVYAVPTTACAVTRTEVPAVNIGIFNVAFHTVDHATAWDGPVMNDYSCTQIAQLQPNTNYPIAVTVGGFNTQWVRVYIDYNGNGNFTDAGELVFAPANGTGVRSGSFTTPVAPTTGVLRRMRVITDFVNTTPGPCTTPVQYGQVEEYGVVFTPAPGIAVAPRVHLEGAYNATTGLMSDALRSAGLVPSVEPYSVLGYSFVGGGGESTTAPVLAVTGSNAIVDWVVVELRSDATPTTVLASKAALLQRDGDVVGTDGTSPVSFTQSAGTYRIAIRHRNHLPVMTLNGESLSSAPATVDLTVGATATFGTDARKSITGTFPALVLWAGDVTFNGQVKYAGGSNDRDPILVRIGGTVPTNTTNGYFPEDVNLNGQVKYAGSANDRDPILVNIGGTVPTAVRNAQLP